jgi:acetyl esterase/lipase
MHSKRISLALSIITALTLSFPANTAHAQQVTHDIVYTTGQLADVYEPAGEGPFPAIVYIHGGSWRSGNKKDFRRLATDLAAQGYVGLSINYNTHSHSWPTSYQQSLAAVRFIQNHAAQYHVDPNKVIVLGTSAGGELAALVALSKQGPAHPPIAAAVILNGVFNLSYNVYVINRYLGAHCSKTPDDCKAASPLMQVTSGEPPFFVGHGTSDHLVPYSQAQIFSDALHNAGDTVTLYSAKGGGHSYWAKNRYYDDNLTAVENFLHVTLDSPAS